MCIIHSMPYSLFVPSLFSLSSLLNCGMGDGCSSSPYIHRVEERYNLDISESAWGRCPHSSPNTLGNIDEAGKTRKADKKRGKVKGDEN